ncbi:MAG: alpha/beta fold hydrolase [Vicinamibacteria bacterium]|nr:alpha/beta fold hydrolase [Vicinamibacteria bacterium]
MLTAILVVLSLSAPQAADSDPLIAETRVLLQGLFAGKTAPLVERFDARMAAALPQDQLTLALTSLKQQAGEFRAIVATKIQERGGVRAIVATCDFANGPVDVTVAYDDKSRIVGLNMRPATPAASPYEAPSYALPDRFTETEVTVDAGGWPLPGTLSMPKGGGPFPAVVLAHGSGPNDRDESLGGVTRPFKDMAWGLASRGIAVLRYDKRTLTHGRRLASLTNFTVKDETIDDALAAVALLRRTARVRADRVYVAGHSLGGMLAPRIGALDPHLGGLIVLAGAVRPLEETILSQTRYLAELDGTVTDDERTQIAAAEALVTRARTLKAGDPPLTGALASGPASYVVDLRGYHPPTVAKSLAMPMLVLQGERDYQVTMDDFGQWRASLGGRKDVRFISYPALNHLFVAGSGKSSPAEYRQPGHVDAAVIEDIRRWILEH